MGKSVDRSILIGEVVEEFRNAIPNPNTRDPYERRLLYFLREVNMGPDAFVNLARENPKAAEKLLAKYVKDEVSRAERGEISKNTIRNPLKAVKLLLDMNDVTNINWRKIKRTLPPARDYALDRIPTTEEIRSILETADLRGKALTLVLLTSGLREGAIESLRISDYSVIRRDDQIVAGRLIVYNRERERYITFISPEALEALENYLAYRRDHGEILGFNSPLFRNTFDAVKGSGVVKPANAKSIRRYYNRLLFSIGIRKQKQRRHEFSVHSLRKFFKTSLAGNQRRSLRGDSRP